MVRNINNNADLFVLRGIYVSKQNRKDLAKQYLDKAKELDPTNREAQELLKSFQQPNKATTAAATAKPANKQKATQDQSIMFQKPKPKKKANPFLVPTR